MLLVSVNVLIFIDKTLILIRKLRSENFMHMTLLVNLILGMSNFHC